MFRGWLLLGSGLWKSQDSWEESRRIDAPDVPDRGCKGHRINKMALTSGLDADAEARIYWLEGQDQYLYLI